MDDELSMDPPLSPEQSELVARLTTDDVARIDAALLALVDDRWRKVASLVGRVMMEHVPTWSGIPDIYFASRIWKMVEAGTLEHAGIVGAMRHCEIRRNPST